MMLALSLVLFTSSLAVVQAGSGAFGAACLQAHSKLSFGNYQLSTECSAKYFCASNNTCAYKGCRTAEYPFGYDPFADVKPPFCPDGQFCPDEEDQCLSLLPVGSPCQLNRDDECAPPDNASELTGPRNNKGAICLNFQCTYANATLSQPCLIENMPYVVYDQEGGKEYVTIVSRDNCKIGLYCDGTQKQCVQLKSLGSQCTADKECESDNCNSKGACDIPISTTVHVQTWVYAIIGAAIIGSMVAVLASLFFFHRKSRALEQEKRAQYWREQEAFRNNILSMREQARVSVLSLPRGDSYKDQDFGSENSRTGLYTAQKSSGLRNNFSDDNTDADSMEEALVQPQDDDDYNSRRRLRKPTGGRV